MTSKLQAVLLALTLTGVGCGDAEPELPNSSAACEAGDLRVGVTACGLNSEGLLSQVCVDGAFEDDLDSCSGADVCTNGNTESRECEGGGVQERECASGQWGDFGVCSVLGCTDPDGTNYNENADVDDGSCQYPPSSENFINHAKPSLIPGRFPTSACDALATHQACVAMEGCGWLRTIKNDGVCRADPVSRCLGSGDCVCRASDFHGETSHDGDLELFLPLSIGWRNLAPGTSSFGGGEDRYDVVVDVEGVLNESLENFTSRTDFSHRTLSVSATSEADLGGLLETDALSLTMKFMHVWDKRPDAMGGVLFEGLGMRAELVDDALTLEVGSERFSVAGEFGGKVKDHQCNQIAVLIGEDGAQVHLGASVTPIPALTIASVRASLQNSQDTRALRIGAVNAKVWDVRLYGRDRLLSADEVAEIGKRCGSAGQYPIPDGYPESNRRYSWGMGGYDIAQNHATGSYSSGVYVTMRIPEPDIFPPTDPDYKDDLKRMIGFWDRWHEQMFFEMDMIPYVDNRQLDPPISANTYRRFEDLCGGDPSCGEPANFNNPCRYVTDLFQGFNWLPEDFPGEPTSADHRRIAQNGGWTRWDSYEPDLYQGWTRPVHEHGHTAHFTLMRTYRKVHHYIRGIAGESFAEIMSFYVLPAVKSWMNNGLTYYPTIPLAFEGRWDPAQEKHVFKSPQPYQEQNIDDLGLGARFYGLGVWWTYVSHYAAKPYLVGRLSADTDETPGTTLQRMRFYLAQEGLDLGELFGNYAAHVAAWDWPHSGHSFYQQEQEPFQGIEGWCTRATEADCTIESLKIQAAVDAETGTQGQWVDGPPDRHPGGFAYSTVKISDAPAGALYEVSLDFEVPSSLFPDTDHQITLRPECRDDPRFFSSRIVVADAGSEGQRERANRPQYYKVPGRSVDKVIIEVPESGPSNIYILAIPTPPFELEDVPGFVEHYSLIWPYKYKVTRLDALPAGAQKAPATILDGQEMLELTPREGNGFLYDCFRGE